MRIQLIDTFNGVRISAHNTIMGAVRAQRKHIAAVKRTNGKDSFLTYGFRLADGSPVDADEIIEAEMNLDYE